MFDAGGTICDTQYGALVAALGLTMPRAKEPDAESPQEARKRLGPAPITYGAAALIVGNFDPRERGLRERVQAANEHRAKELELIDEAWKIASDEARDAHHRAVVSQREQVIAAIDRALADSPMSARWFWLRAVRRLAAGERQVAIADNNLGFDYSVEQLFSLARAAGAHINVSTPSKKK
jgi:hypothetical protein